MSALAFYAGYKWTDQPECVDPVIRRLCIALNDLLPSDAERERVIGPHLMAPIGTNQGRELTLKRAFACADRAVRAFAPKALLARGREDLAIKLMAVPEIVDRGTAIMARDIAWKVRAADAAAYAAAYAAAAAAAARRVARHEDLLQLILDLCAMERCEVPQKRNLAELPT